MTNILSTVLAQIIIIVIVITILYFISKASKESQPVTEEVKSIPNALNKIDNIVSKVAPPLVEKPHKRGTIIMTKYQVLVYGPDETTVVSKTPLPDDADRFTVGGSEDDDIYINDGRVSSKHLIFGSDDQGIFFRDNKSTNGTRMTLQGERITTDINVENGLFVYIGPVKIGFVLSSEDAADNNNETGQKLMRMNTVEEVFNEKTKIYKPAHR